MCCFNRDPQFCARRPFSGYLRVRWWGDSWVRSMKDATWFGNQDNLRKYIEERFLGTEYTIVRRVCDFTEVEVAKIVVSHQEK